MKNYIYISDLDGTLLNGDKQISDFTKHELNDLIRRGCQVSIATARTPATVEVLLEDIQIQEPIILMNGAVLYDLQMHKYLDIEFIGKDVATAVIAYLGELVKLSFIYTINNNELIVYYQELENDYKRTFYQERQDTHYKRFIKQEVEEYNNIAYFVFMDEEAQIKRIYETIKDIEGIALVMYRDVYSKEGYILEVYSNKATKGNAIHKLKKTGYEHVVCFGDNLNDLCMFKVADEAYAVENALPQVKDCATAIIESNNNDGVAKYIASHYQKITNEKGENEKC